MLIKILKTTKASKNQMGNECFDYIQGNTYDIYEELAKVFISEKWGVEESNKKNKTIEEVEEKAIEELENKAILNSEENKAIEKVENKSMAKKKKK